MGRIEIGCSNHAFQFGRPQVFPAVEGHPLGDRVRQVADGIDIGPCPDVGRADFCLLDQVHGIRDLGHVQFFEQPVVVIKPADMRGGEGHVAFRGVTAELGLVQAIDRAAGDEFDIDTGFLGEFLGDGFVDQVAKATAPAADDEGFGECGGRQQAYRSGGQEETFHMEVPVG